MDRVIDYKSDALPKNLTAKPTPAAYERKKVIMEKIGRASCRERV